MAKKDNKSQTNVSQQLKQFSKNLGEDVVPKPPRDFTKKVDTTPLTLDTIIEPTEIYINLDKISKEELIQLVQNIPTIQIPLRNEIIDMVNNDCYKLDICTKLDQIHTFDLVRINSIKQNL